MGSPVNGSRNALLQGAGDSPRGDLKGAIEDGVDGGTGRRGLIRGDGRRQFAVRQLAQLGGVTHALGHPRLGGEEARQFLDGLGALDGARERA